MVKELPRLLSQYGVFTESIFFGDTKVKINGALYRGNHFF